MRFQEGRWGVEVSSHFSASERGVFLKKGRGSHSRPVNKEDAATG